LNTVHAAYSIGLRGGNSLWRRSTAFERHLAKNWKFNKIMYMEFAHYSVTPAGLVDKLMEKEVR
jgi:hypothetical protein